MNPTASVSAARPDIAIRTRRRVLAVCESFSYTSGGCVDALETVRALHQAGCEVLLWSLSPAQVELNQPWLGDLTRYESPPFFWGGRGIGKRLARFREEVRFLRMVRLLRPTLCLVLTDRPRLVYRLVNRWTRVVFFVQDVTHTCPGDPPHRYLKVSRSACARPAGLSCLGVDRVEGCLGDRVWWRKLYRIAHSVLTARLLSGIDTIVTQSSFSEALVRRGLSRSARVIVHPRIHPAAQATELPGKPEEARRRLGFVGRVETYKGILEAIEILALLPETYCLKIIGSGGAEPEARRLVRERGLERRVAFIGWLERAETARAVAACGVVLVPSLCAEVFGMVGPEALDLGTPVVAYSVGGVPEWCDGAVARTVPLGDRAAAAEAVLEITGDSDRWRSLCEQARVFARTCFDETRSRKRLLAILEVGPREARGGAAC